MLRIVFLGTPEFAIPSLQILTNKAEIVAVATQPDRPKGRGRKLIPPPIKGEAQRRGLPVLQPEKIREPQFFKMLASLAPELVVVVAYGKILPPEILTIPRLGCVNLHASLLPAYRGAAPIARTIINGESETGVTTMRMDVGMDTGPILMQRRVAIGPQETAGELSLRLSKIGAGVLAETIEGLAAGALHSTPQPEAGVSYAPPLKKEEGRIAWERDAIAITNLIRGTDPWPGAYAFYKKKRLIVRRASPRPGKGASPGEILAAGRGVVEVATGNGYILIHELQPEGGKRMSAAEFLAGHPLVPGERFE